MPGLWHSSVLGGIAVLASCTGGGEPAAPDQEAMVDMAASTPQTRNARLNSSSSAPVADAITYEGELTQGGFIRGKVSASTKSLSFDGEELKIGPDREFFVAFDRDSSGSAKLVQAFEDGTSRTETLTITPRKWQISRVNVPRGRGRNLEAYWKKREPEYNAIVAARAKSSDTDGWKQEFIWPVKGRISGYFGRQRIYAGEPGSYHSGIDIAPGNGVPYVAPADGVVTLARMGFSLEGGLIIIDHGNGLNSAFLHSSKIAVKEGQRVKQGEYIGNVGATGRASGPHLHWGLKWGKSRLDPLLFVGPMN